MQVGLIAMGTKQAAAIARPITKTWPTMIVADDTPTVEAMAGTTASVVGSLEELAAACPVIVFREVADDEHVERLIARLAAAMPPNGIVVNTRPYGQPSVMRRWAEIARDAGVELLDAMTSGPHADLHAPGPSWDSLMVGGDRDAFERSRGVLETIADVVAYVGGPGNGEMAKLVNTLVFNANAMVVAELLRLGEQLGFDLQGLLDLIRASSGDSYALDSLADGTMDRWDSRERNMKMFRTRIDAISADIREQGLPPSPLEEWARKGLASLESTMDRIAALH